MTVIVVGVDGSNCSQVALDFAIEEATLRSYQMLIVTAWEPANDVGFWATRAVAAVESARAGAEFVAKDAVARVGRSAPHLVVESFVSSGRPEKVLLEKAQGAALLVVGSRGRGGFTGLLLGSVSQYVVSRADCPVVVVPAPPGC